MEADTFITVLHWYAKYRFSPDFRKKDKEVLRTMYEQMSEEDKKEVEKRDSFSLNYYLSC